MMRSAKPSHPKRLAIYAIRKAMARSRTSNHIPFLPTPKFSNKNKRYKPNNSTRQPVQAKALVTILLMVILLQVKHHRGCNIRPLYRLRRNRRIETLHYRFTDPALFPRFRTSEMGFCYSPEGNGTRDQPEDADNHFIQMPTEA